MVEQGKVVKILKNIAQVEISSNPNCGKCGGCITLSSGKRVLQAYNGVSAKVGDTVNVIVEGSKIKAGFFLYILPLISFFFFLFLGMNIIHIKSEPVLALIGFGGMILTYFIISIFFHAPKIKNFVIEVVKKNK